MRSFWITFSLFFGLMLMLSLLTHEDRSVSERFPLSFDRTPASRRLPPLEFEPIEKDSWFDGK